MLLYQCLGEILAVHPLELHQSERDVEGWIWVVGDGEWLLSCRPECSFESYPVFPDAIDGVVVDLLDPAGYLLDESRLAAS